MVLTQRYVAPAVVQLSRKVADLEYYKIVSIEAVSVTKSKRAMATINTQRCANAYE